MEDVMAALTEIKAIAHSARGTLVQDVLGAASLVIMLVIALHLPVFY